MGSVRRLVWGCSPFAETVDRRVPVEVAFEEWCQPEGGRRMDNPAESEERLERREGVELQCVSGSHFLCLARPQLLLTTLHLPRLSFSSDVQQASDHPLERTVFLPQRKPPRLLRPDVFIFILGPPDPLSHLETLNNVQEDVAPSARLLRLCRRRPDDVGARYGGLDEGTRGDAGVGGAARVQTSPSGPRSSFPPFSPTRPSRSLLLIFSATRILMVVGRVGVLLPTEEDERSGRGRRRSSA